MVGTKMDRTWQQRTTEGAYKRPNFPNELKRRLVEQSLKPGASLSLIARDNDINANLLFKWRKRYFEGAYGLPSQLNPTTSTVDWKGLPLLPVSVIAEPSEPELPKPSDALPPVENVCIRHADPSRRRPSRKLGFSRGRSFCASHNNSPAGQRPLSQGAGIGPLACAASVPTVAVDPRLRTGPGGSFAVYSTKPSCRQKLKRRMPAR